MLLANVIPPGCKISGVRISRLQQSIFFALSCGVTSSLFAAESTNNTAAVVEEKDVKQLESVVVVGKRTSEAEIAIGKGKTQNTVAITHQALLSAPAGTSGLKMLEQLAGFNVQTNDPLGLYEFGNSVSVRAFNFQQIGFVLDDIPLGRNDAFGGSPIFRYVDNENINRVIASTGTGDVTFPSYVSLGPSIEYQTLAPNSEAGGTVVATIGSDSLRRSFIKLETGEHAGWSGYLSRSKIDSDLWRGPGDIDREHIDAKARFESQAGHELTFKIVYNNLDDYDVPYISYTQYNGLANDLFGRSGRKFAYIDYLPDLPETTQGVKFSNSGYNQYYSLARNKRKDTLYGVSGKFIINPIIQNKTTVYYEDKKGFGVSPEAYSTSLALYNAQKDIIQNLYAPKGIQYGLSSMDGERYGINTAFQIDLEDHYLETGVWLEYDKYHRKQARYNIQDGNPSLQALLNEPVHLQRDYQSKREISQFYVQDKWQINPKISTTLGVKAVNFDYQVKGYRNATDYIQQQQPQIDKTWKDNFLPYLGILYKPNTRDEIFASFAQNMALPRGADDILTQSAPTIPAPSAETSDNFEIGYRLNHPQFNASIAAYLTNFNNRIQAYASPIPGSTQVENWYQNVGKSQAWGAELSGTYKPTWLANKVVINGNLTFNQTELKDNLSNLKIAGNEIPDSPEIIVQLGTTYEINDWVLLNLSAKHIGKRYTNLINTEQTPSFTLVNAYLDLGGKNNFGLFKDIKLRFNIDNIFDKDYIGSIYSTVNTPSVFFTGAERSYQASLTFAF
ncbi:TonB-dependent receptor [Acinetobacter puyangensis]|uniref:TonB-dependent receptor n=1 Tax=Acinetobacter puyangensis TaxID=1096779 RepID=UPI003A4E181C